MKTTRNIESTGTFHTVRLPHPPVEIRLEIETTPPGEERAVYQTPIPYNGEIMHMTDAKKRASVKKAWRLLSHSKHEKLLAFHLPVTHWQRVAI